MTYARVVGAIALLGLLAACDDSRAPDGGATPVMDVGHTPIVVKQGETRRLPNWAVVRALTTAQSLEYWEKNALEHPERLDEPRWGGGEHGVRVPSMTDRESLEHFRWAYAMILAKREARALAGDNAFRALEAYSLDTEEAIEFLERREAEQPGFLDEVRRPPREDGITTPYTFRRQLEILKAHHARELAARDPASSAGSGAAKGPTRAESIEVLEHYEAERPGFLDEPRYLNDGSQLRYTYREILDSLKVQLARETAARAADSGASGAAARPSARP